MFRIIISARGCHRVCARLEHLDDTAALGREVDCAPVDLAWVVISALLDRRRAEEVGQYQEMTV